MDAVHAALTDSQMSIDRSVTRGTRQVLVLPVRDMQVGLRVAVLLGQTKIVHVDL
jgi:hypothetical protein